MEKESVAGSLETRELIAPPTLFWADGVPWAGAGSRAPNGCDIESSQLKVFLMPESLELVFLQFSLWLQFKFLCKVVL